MPANPYSLRELSVTLAARLEGYRASYELREFRPYPPFARAQTEDTITVLSTATTDLPAAALATLETPAADKAGGAMEAWRERMAGIAEVLFAGQARSLLDQTLGPPCWPDKEARPDFYTRLALAFDSPALAAAPWELLALDGEELSRRCAIVRRVSEPANRQVVPLSLPMQVGVTSLVDAVPEGQVGAWADELFMGWPKYVRDQRGFAWGPYNPRAPIHIRHVLFDSSGARSIAALRRILLSYRSLARSRGSVPPHLLVLHDASAQAPLTSAGPLAQDTLAGGIDVALLVAFGSADPASGQFLPIFYRKLLHNWPLDQCVLQALRGSYQLGGWPLHWAFAAQEGGELQLLITRAVAEAAQPAQRLVPPPTGFTKGAQRGGRMVTAPPSRLLRARNDLQRRVREVIERDREKIEATVESVSEMVFVDESHDVSVAVQAFDTVTARAAAVVRAEEAIVALGRQTPASVQEATVRLTNLWLTEGESEAARDVPDKSPLVVESEYGVHVRIGSRREGAIAAVAFPDEALREVFERHERVLLDVVFFAAETDFKLSGRWAELELPCYGPSTEVVIVAVPQRTGICHLRAGIYYCNAMLQSLLMEAQVVEAGVAPAVSDKPALIAREVDYVANPDLALLEELPRPMANIFTNELADGTHWMGLFAKSDDPHRPVASGMHTFTPNELETLAQNVRTLLFDIEGKVAYWQYRSPLDERQVAARERDFVALAVKGYTLYDSLFWSRADSAERSDELKKFTDALLKPGIVSVARCRGQSPTVPWAALYDLPVDGGQAEQIKLCEVFKGQVAAGELQDYPTCRHNPSCPVASGKTMLTVCPYGFWGFRHQIEQPIQAVTPTASGQVPPELERPEWSQAAFIERNGDGPVTLTVAASGDRLLGAIEHRVEIEALREHRQLQVVYQEERSQVLQLLSQGGFHIRYFYCHGRIEENEFRLEVGPFRHPGYISAANLMPMWRWRKPQSLVVLNGCETMALTADRIHGFMGKLRLIGASGIVGTEIEVKTGLARPFGTQLLAHFLDGRSLGEAILDARRQLLLECNPLGLVYSPYAPANLHLHSGETCDWCMRNGEQPNGHADGG